MPTIDFIPGMQIDYNLPLSDFIGRHKILKATGYRPISICLHEQAVVPHYTVVWIQQPGPSWEMLYLATQSEVEDYLNKPGLIGARWPRLIAAVRGSNGYAGARYAVVVEKQLQGPFSRIEYKPLAAELKNHLEQAHIAGNEYVRCVAPFGTNWSTSDTLRYAVVWETQPSSYKATGRSRQNRSCLPLHESSVDKVHKAIESGFAHVEQCSPVAGSAGLRYATIFRDEVIAGSEVVRDVGVADLPDLIATKALTGKGKWPIRLHGTAIGDDQRFSVVFADHGHYLPEPRTFHMERRVADGGTGQQFGIDYFAPFDNYIKPIMQDNNVRACQVAVAWQDRLVYTAAYTWAEDDYPKTTIGMRMRVGSISKVITALGIMRLTELHADKLPQGLATPVVDILGPALPAGSMVADPDLATRTLDHLLGQLGKFKKDDAIAEILDLTQAVFPAVGKAFFSNPNNPPQEVIDARLNFSPDYYTWYALTQNATSLLSQKTAPTPGLAIPQAAQGGGVVYMLPTPDYSNLGFFLLGQVIRTVGGGNYDEWLGVNLLSRGHLTQAKSTIHDASAAKMDLSEVRYHPRSPDCGSELYGADVNALAPSQYGALYVPTLLPPGGWALPMYECAWIFSRINPAGSALFDDPSTTAEALKPLAAGKDRVVYQDKIGSKTYLHHNGGLQGTTAIAFRRSDGLTVAVAMNSDLPGGMTIQIKGAEIAAKAKNMASWPTGDLFPELLP